MKLSKIYSNKKDLFEPIKFNDGLNVIYADVKNPKKTNKDSHNLGKTLLISLLDFMLLCKFVKGHFLYDNQELFKEFVFYLEIKTNEGKYITIKRAVLNNTKISFKFHDMPDQDFTELKSDGWDEFEIAFEKSKDLLNSKLGLKVLGEWDYRKGITYFLREQNDWSDVFMISKFSQNDHEYWKPYLAHILGFDAKKVQEKYDFDHQIEELKELKEKHQKLIQVTPEEYDKIKGQIEIKQIELDEARARVDNFNYFKDEIQSNRVLVEEIEQRISEINESIYNIKYEVERINDSLKEQPEFKVENLKILFDEIGMQFKNDLVRDFENLKKFNEKITVERSKSLKVRLEILLRNQEALIQELEKLNFDREQKLSFLKTKDTFKKARMMQENVTKYELEIANLKTQLNDLNIVSSYDTKISELDKQEEKVIESISSQVKEGNNTFKDIRINFNDMIKEVLDYGALLSIKLNKEGNLEFQYGIMNKDDPELMTQQGKGTSYKKLLCAVFDLSVLKVHCKHEFFKFVYHDGVLEGLDNRKKILFLDLIKKFSKDYGIQYILTVIDADMPRDANDKKVEFEKTEIIKELDDSGDSGRLFKMPIF